MSVCMYAGVLNCAFVCEYVFMCINVCFVCLVPGCSRRMYQVLFAEIECYWRPARTGTQWLAPTGKPIHERPRSVSTPFWMAVWLTGKAGGGKGVTCASWLHRRDDNEVWKHNNMICRRCGICRSPDDDRWDERRNIVIIQQEHWKQNYQRIPRRY